MLGSKHPLSNRYAFRVVMLVCWIGGFAAAGTTQDRAMHAPAIPESDYVSRAKELVQKLYPSMDPLRHAEIWDDKPWGQPGVMHVFHLQLRDHSPRHDEAGNPCSCWKLALDAGFVFNSLSSDKELIDLIVSDAATKTRQERFEEMVRRHPQWSDAQVIQAAKEAGAKYGPKDKEQLLAALPLAELKPYIGELKVERAEFVLRRPEGKGAPPVGEGVVCFWRVNGTAHLVSGAEKGYLLVVDAFEGRLLRVKQGYR